MRQREREHDAGHSERTDSQRCQEEPDPHGRSSGPKSEAECCSWSVRSNHLPQDARIKSFLPCLQQAAQPKMVERVELLSPFVGTTTAGEVDGVPRLGEQ